MMVFLVSLVVSGNPVILFTADLHLGHRNIINFTKRPFRSVEEMDRKLIANWNSVVGEDDIVYMLGDFTLRGLSVARRYSAQLNGHISIVPGSHDKKWLRELEKGKPPLMSSCGKVVTILPPLYALYVSKFPPRKDKQVIILCHYAMRVWDKSHYNSWQLYGHSHGRLRGIGKQYDVGVDNNDFYPVSLEELNKILRAAPSNLNFVGRR